jgi:CubicO group peptidase (beta-lactamase class C family)
MRPVSGAAATAALCLAALAVAAPSAAAQQKPPAPRPRAGAPLVDSAAIRRTIGTEHLVDSLFADYAAPGAPGASVVAVRDGRVVLRASFGLANLDPRVAATPHSDYRLASLTKQFTAMAVMILAEHHRLGFDDPVSRYLPGLPAYASGVTIRHLLNHTSGIWAYEDFVPDSQTYQVKDADVLQLIQRADSLYFPPGSAYRYSNTGYSLLALVVERVSGMPFARFLKRHIFVPAGMQGSVAFQEGISRVPRRAYGFTAEGTRFLPTDQSNTSAVLGDGGIYTSVDDLVLWYRALERGTLVRPATQLLAWTPAALTNGQPSGYGFGWFVERDAHGLRLWHHGETRGFTNGIVVYPDQHLMVAVLTNRSGGAPWDIAQRLAEHFLR